MEIDFNINETAQDVAELLKDKKKLLTRKPFTRGATIRNVRTEKSVSLGSKVTAQHSGVRKKTISQDVYISELDPYMHTVLFDENLPSICVKTKSNDFFEVKEFRTPLAFQRSIVEKQTLHMAGNPMKFTLSDKKPTEEMQKMFVMFKHYWDLRNQDGMKVKMVSTAKSYGDAGLLYYMDRKGEVRSRLLSYDDGYVICSHNDDNGDRILEAVYYTSGDEEYIDCWDDTFFYRYSTTTTGEWTLSREAHGFGEIPLITKRTNVAWENAQHLIESYEILYNIFQVLQKKWGWGMLYIKGKIDPNAQKIAGNIVLNDISYDDKGDAKFLEPPAPQNMIDTLDNIFDRIQIVSGTTFILPKDIHTSSDTSGVSVKMTQSLDIQTANNGIVEWQNVADKMVRLFKRGLAMELVRKGIMVDAITKFDTLNINAHFDVWQPYSESEWNQMLCTMKNAGILSVSSAVENNTVSRPDEIERIKKEADAEFEKQLEQQKRQAEITAQTQTQNGGNNND